MMARELAKAFLVIREQAYRRSRNLIACGSCCCHHAGGPRPRSLLERIAQACPAEQREDYWREIAYDQERKGNFLWRIKKHQEAARKH
jgi:hypothetical protein